MVVEDGSGPVDQLAEYLALKEPMAEDPGGEGGDVEAEMVAPAVGSEAGPTTQTSPQSWKWSVIYLCVYGFMASIKPGEPFITPNLLSHEKNFTSEQPHLTLVSHHQQQRQQHLRELAADNATKAERDSMNPREGKPATGSGSPSPWHLCTLSWRESVFVQMLMEVRGMGVTII
ncbi:Folate transporter 1 [Merluccius polli]|uniref:Folate transporter 1 n=1 Tax=Merluccius polli TaxID=89951 RepID=A0AA47NRH8_MERPO|nr:Folate transporter 1 [Merluccius polli]